MWNPQGLYAKFLLRQPTIFFGKDSVFGLANYPTRCIAVIHGSSLPAADKDTLKKVFQGKELFFLPRSWSGEPDIDGLMPTVRALEDCRPDMILAVGGGSVIDGAKLCRVYYEWPYFSLGKTRVDDLSFKTRFAVMPTIIGSGAEASSAAVYIDRLTHKKEMLVSHGLQPDAVVLDPHFVQPMGETELLPTMMDAMAHILEGYVSLVENPMADILAEEGLSLFAEELARPWEEMDFSRLQYAGYLGGIVQNHCLVGAAHAAAHQLSEDGYAHGEAVAMLLGGTIASNSREPSVKEKYDRLCRRAGLGETDSLLILLQELLTRAGLASRQSKLKKLLAARMADRDFLRRIAEDRGGKGNPLPLNESYLNDWVERIC